MADPSSTNAVWDRDELKQADAVLLSLLAPNTSTFFPSPWNVNMVQLEAHMTRMLTFAIPEHVLRITGGFVRSPLTHRQLVEESALL